MADRAVWGHFFDKSDFHYIDPVENLWKTKKICSNICRFLGLFGTWDIRFGVGTKCPGHITTQKQIGIFGRVKGCLRRFWAYYDILLWVCLGGVIYRLDTNDSP